MIDFVNITNKELLNYLLSQKIIFNKKFSHSLVKDFLYDFYMVELNRENLKEKNFFGFYPILQSIDNTFNFAPEQYTKIYISFGITSYKNPLCFNINDIFYEGMPQLSIDKNHYYIAQSAFNFDFTSQINNNYILYSYLEQDYAPETRRDSVEKDPQFQSSGPSFTYNNFEYFYYIYRQTGSMIIVPFQLLSNLILNNFRGVKSFLLSDNYIEDIIILDREYNRQLQINSADHYAPPGSYKIIDDFQLTDINDKFPKPYDVLPKD